MSGRCPGGGELLDLGGVPCPANASRALLRLETMAPGELLVLLLDGGEPVVNVPEALAAEGHELVGSEELGGGRWRVVVRRGEEA